MKNTTLCYIENNDSYLMMHRIKKDNDLNKDKWIGLGGKIEEFESPYECVIREVREESGLNLKKADLRGIITFVSDDFHELMFLYTADSFEGDLIESNKCNEGVLCWVKKDKIEHLNLWEGDLIFLSLLEERNKNDVFELKLVYRQEKLCEAVLDGVNLPC